MTKNFLKFDVDGRENILAHHDLVSPVCLIEIRKSLDMLVENILYKDLQIRRMINTIQKCMLKKSFKYPLLIVAELQNKSLQTSRQSRIYEI